jgi:hypothetical protein
MQPNSKYPKIVFIFCLIVSGLFFLSSNIFASGGRFWDYDKIDHNISASYTFMTPIGSFKDQGERGGTGYAKMGQGFELEYMHYWTLADDEHFRWGIGASMPFFFMPVNPNVLNPQLTTEFSKDQFSNTSFISPKHDQWFAWGLGVEGSLMWTTNRFSVEATLKMGNMYVYAPNYRLIGGSYVPPGYSQYFPYEGGGGGKGAKTIYMNFGMQANLFITEEFGIFAGVGFQYMNPTFKKDLTYIENVNNEPTVQRKTVSVNQEMMFVQFRFGVTINIPHD